MTARVALDPPWLAVHTDAPVRVLSWSLNRPGFVETDCILWREVRNADLPRNFDVLDWLTRELATKDKTHAVAFLTSRDVRAYHDVTVTVGNTSVQCIATVGLSNAEHIGTRLDRSHHDWGTINILVLTDIGITDAARIEAVGIVSQARTLAVLEAELDLPTGRASGTGTDCIAVAAPSGETGFCGMHTELGHAMGQAVYKAVSAGVTEWMQTIRREAST